jgi:hypothetical protein
VEDRVLPAYLLPLVCSSVDSLELSTMTIPPQVFKPTAPAHDAARYAAAPPCDKVA